MPLTGYVSRDARKTSTTYLAIMSSGDPTFAQDNLYDVKKALPMDINTLYIVYDPMYKSKDRKETVQSD